MKLRNMLFAAAALLVATSCSNIGEDERYTYVKPAEVGRAVLIEDFTGQKCSNCPTANDIVKGLMEQYGEDNVIAVGIHSGPLGFKGNAKNIGLVTATGEEYYKGSYHVAIPSQPFVLCNRSTSTPKTDEIATLVYNEIQKKAPLSITLDNTYDAGTRTVTIDVNMLGIEGISGKLQVWAVEDSIVAMQTLPSGSVQKDYVHNHVFRTSVNDKWGDDISLAEGASATKQYTLKLEDNWVDKHMAIVAFVYNSDGVLQTTRKAVIATAPEDGNK